MNEEFVLMYGVTKEGGTGKIDDVVDTTMKKCATICSENKNCNSFEWMPEEKRCQLNQERRPNTRPTKNVLFCSRMTESMNCSERIYIIAFLT